MIVGILIALHRMINGSLRTTFERIREAEALADVPRLVRVPVIPMLVSNASEIISLLQREYPEQSSRATPP